MIGEGSGKKKWARKGGRRRRWGGFKPDFGSRFGGTEAPVLLPLPTTMTQPVLFAYLLTYLQR